MRPAAASDYWRQLAGSLDTKAVDGINLIECDAPRTEALTIAVLIRRALETPGRTIALITPDRNLARRVAGELQRWEIIVDDSAGIPLAQTPWGIFMRLAATAVSPDAGKEQILALLKINYLPAAYQNNRLPAPLKNLIKSCGGKIRKTPMPPLSCKLFNSLVLNWAICLPYLKLPSPAFCRLILLLPKSWLLMTKYQDNKRCGAVTTAKQVLPSSPTGLKKPIF